LKASGRKKKSVAAEARSVRSINLLLDAADAPARLDHFHLTRKGAAIVHKIVSLAAPGRRSQRVMTIAAPPGSGKSFLALFAGAVLSQRSDSRAAVSGVLSRASQRARFLEAEVEAFARSKARILPLYIVGDAAWGLHAAIFAALEAAVIREIPDQSQRCLGKIQARLQKLKIVGGKKGHLSFADSRRFFEAFDVALEELEGVGFSGAAIFHDEFNRFLARESRSFSAQLDFLQDLAEYTARKSKPVFLILLTHKSISQYSDNVSPGAMRDWQKIEGRFHPVLYQEDSADIYTVLSHRIGALANARKPDAQTEKAIKEAADIIPLLNDEFDGRFNAIARRAYPLSPAAFLALPLVSNLLGQNERTAFSFIDDLASKKGATVVGLPELFDYFDTHIDRLQESVGAVIPWLRARKAMSASTSAVSRGMLKSLSVLTLLDSPLLPATVEVLSWSLSITRKEGRKILADLADRGLAVLRESTGRYEVHYGSAVNVRRAVDELSLGITTGTCQEILHEAVALRPVHAVDFNAHNYTARYYARKVLLTRYLEELGLGRADDLFPAGLLHVKKLIEQEIASGGSGVVFFLMGDPDRSRRIASFLLRDAEIKENALFVLTHSPGLDLALLQRYAAARTLLGDKKFIEKDPRSREDLEMIAGDLHDGVEDALHQSFSAQNGELVDAGAGRTTARGRLDQIVSARLKERYPHMPRINCELINRESISPNIRNARKKVIRGILDQYGTDMLGFSGYGPEVTIFRCVFVATRAYVPATDLHWKFDFSGVVDCVGGENPGLYLVMQKIHELLQTRGTDRTFTDFYTVLSAAPYGVCRELIPLFLVAALTEKTYSYSLYEEGRFVAVVNSDVIEKMHATPHRFSIRVLDENEDHAALLQAYEDHFKPREYDAGGENRLVRGLLYVLQWFARLPESTRNSRSISDRSKAFLEAVGRSRSPEELLFETLPATLECRDIRSFHAAVGRVRGEIDGAYPALVRSVEGMLLQQLSRYLYREKPDGLLACVSQFLDENSERISIVVHHDLAVRRLIERLRMPYAAADALVESVASLLTDAHPRYWKDETPAQMEMNLVTLLGKLDQAAVLGAPSDRVARIVKDFSRLSLEEKRRALADMEASARGGVND